MYVLCFWLQDRPHEIEASHVRGGISPRVPLVDAGEPRGTSLDQLLGDSARWFVAPYGWPVLWVWVTSIFQNRSSLPVFVDGAQAHRHPPSLHGMVGTFKIIPMIKRVKAPTRHAGWKFLIVVAQLEIVVFKLRSYSDILEALYGYVCVIWSIYSRVPSVRFEILKSWDLCAVQWCFQVCCIAKSQVWLASYMHPKPGECGDPWQKTSGIPGIQAAQKGPLGCDSSGWSLFILWHSMDFGRYNCSFPVGNGGYQRRLPYLKDWR